MPFCGWFILVIVGGASCGGRGACGGCLNSINCGTVSDLSYRREEREAPRDPHHPHDGHGTGRPAKATPVTMLVGLIAEVVVLGGLIERAALKADHVTAPVRCPIVLPAMGTASYREYRHGGYEAENRVAYVAVTRARERLIIVHPTTRRFYDYPSVACAGGHVDGGQPGREEATR